MTKKRWIRIGALALSLVLLISMAGASTYDLDLDDDGKINVWDIQLAVNDSKEAAYQAAILEDILGNPDELHTNSDGVYEIWTALGLYNMTERAKETASFKLMRDIDLGGRDWTPIGQFCGTLDGNGYAIKNFTVTKSTLAGNSTDDVTANNQNMGFISTIEKTGTVKNLKLEQVEIVATENAVFIGLLSGSNRGKVIDCTTQGYVTDTRTTLTGNVYVGTVVGRNNNGTGTVTVTSAMEYLEVTAGSSNPADKVTGVTSKMGMDFAVLSADSAGTRKIGIAGSSKAEQIDTSLIWQDNSNDFTRLSATEQERRETAVEYMYTQGTMKWTTSELLTYTVNGSKTSTHSNIYIPGVTYSGIPYNSVGGGYERALSIMQSEKDSQGRFVTVTGLENGIKDENGNTGFITVMGNDCSSAVGWAWAAASPSRLVNEGVIVNTTPHMIPNEYNTANYGVYPAGGYQTLTTNAEKYSQGVDARDTQSIIALNGGAEGMATYYANSNRGDALLCVEYDLDTTTDTWVKGTGHARMLAYEPVVIRNYKGVADLEKSYVITYEQGDGLFDNRNSQGKYDTKDGYNIKQTSWRIDYKYTLSNLLTEEGFNAATDTSCGWGYVPVTIRAFSYEGNLRAPYYNAGYTTAENYHPVAAPNNGWYYSNWNVVNATLIVTDANGNELYNKTEFVMGRCHACNNLKLDVLFPDADDGLVDGTTYYWTLKATASNGVVTTIKNNEAFTYPVAIPDPPAATAE